MEFRCFVSGGVLTAVSQYRHLLCFPRLVRHADQVLQALRSFVDTVAAPRLKGLFPADDYILDLAVELNPSQGAANVMVGSSSSSSSSSDSGSSAPLPITRTWAIEVNPFFETTDAALFSWTKDADILMGRTTTGGATAPDFRFRSSPAKGASSLMYGSWREIMAECSAEC
jgi:hypothetical protein